MQVATYTRIRIFKIHLASFSRRILNKPFTHFPTLATLKEASGNSKKLSVVHLHAEFCRMLVTLKKWHVTSAGDLYPVTRLWNNTTEAEIGRSSVWLFHKTEVQFFRTDWFDAWLNELVFPNLQRMAQKILTLLGSAYVCEQTFIVMNIGKACRRSKLTDQHLRSGVAKLFNLRAEFVTAWSLKSQIQGDLRNLCKNRLLKRIVVQ